MTFVLVSCVCSIAQVPASSQEVGPAAGAVDQAQEISGTVLSAANDEPLQGATVKLEHTNIITLTDENGDFSLQTNRREGILEVSFLGYVTQEVPFSGTSTKLAVSLETDEGVLEEVVVSTGYQEIPKERATGSFVQIDNEMLNRRVSTNIIDRLKGVASGVLFDKTTGIGVGFNIRGRSTIFANTDPLIVLDNFPYDGDLGTINPNDVESITILRDAAAASIWGVRASNGVVVITTKTGKLNEPAKVSFNGNVTLGDKPRLFSSPELGPSEIVDIEKYLYSKGYFDRTIASPYPFITPVVQVMDDFNNGKITEAGMQQKINSLQGHDLRNDLLGHYYRPSLNQQYSLNITGGGKQNRYYLSVGYDRNMENLVSNSNDRFTINAHNTYRLLKDKLEAGVGINFSSSNTVRQSGNILDQSYIRPYTSLVDQSGEGLYIPSYRQSWLDTIGNGRLLDWRWKPLDELKRNNNRRTLTNYLLNVNLSYAIAKNLDASVIYQYGKGNTDINDLSVAESYYTRDLINQFSQVNDETGEVARPVPMGDILSKGTIQHTSQNLRAQVNYSKSSGQHAITALAGAEVKDYQYEFNKYTLYGYDKSLGTAAAVNHADFFRSLVTGRSQRIGGAPSQSGSTDRYASFFANAQYTYKGRYGVSGSARRDESNLFGVKANQRGVPLWSVGASWAISKEQFYHVPWLQDLKLRLTHGYNGNVDKTVSAFVTARSFSSTRYGLPYASLLNPPNPSLRWEKVGMTNIALDFSAFDGRIGGSVEYYHKRGRDIIGNSPLPPSSGITTFKGNSADISGNGIDINLNTMNMAYHDFKWNTTLLFSKSSDKIVDYKVKTSPLDFHVGYPFNGIFSYRWAGLDSETGDPLGYYGGEVSKDWTKIYNADSLGKTTMYSGAGTPVYFGSMLNTFRYKQVSVSFTITYKLGYYFRSPSVEYSELYALRSSHQDYRARWQNAGDEQSTSVPSSVYPANSTRDAFYTNSEILIEKGDHIRLQDIQISYYFPGDGNPMFKAASIYLYADNLGILWGTNAKGIDPENTLLKPQRTISIGFRVQF